MYKAPKKYTETELADFITLDLIRDAEFAERQAINGPYYPEKGITRESLLVYAAECRQKISGRLDL